MYNTPDRRRIQDLQAAISDAIEDQLPDGVSGHLDEVVDICTAFFLYYISPLCHENSDNESRTIASDYQSAVLNYLEIGYTSNEAVLSAWRDFKDLFEDSPRGSLRLECNPLMMSLMFLGVRLLKKIGVGG